MLDRLGRSMIRGKNLSFDLYWDSLTLPVQCSNTFCAEQ